MQRLQLELRPQFPNVPSGTCPHPYTAAFAVMIRARTSWQLCWGVFCDKRERFLNPNFTCGMWCPRACRECSQCVADVQHSAKENDESSFCWFGYFGTILCLVSRECVSEIRAEAKGNDGTGFCREGWGYLFLWCTAHKRAISYGK